MTDQQEAQPIPSASQGQLPNGDSSADDNSEPNGKVVPIRQEALQERNLELELKFIELEHKSLELEVEIANKRLELERKRLEFETQKVDKQMEWESKRVSLDNDRGLSELKKSKEELEIERVRLEIETLRQSTSASLNEQMEARRNQRRIDGRANWFKMGVSTILIGAGLTLVFKGDNLGAYLLGTGAGGAGIEAASELVKKRDEREKVLSSGELTSQKEGNK